MPPGVDHELLLGRRGDMGFGPYLDSDLLEILAQRLAGGGAEDLQRRAPVV
jgi:hypothetical protein